MPDISVTNPSVVVNNIAIPVIPNSVMFTDGLGEQKQRPQSAGGGNVDLVYSDNVETHIAKVKFKLINTAANMDAALGWKTNGNANVITITGNGLNRSFAAAALVNDFENNLGVDGEIELEFSTLPAA